MTLLGKLLIVFNLLAAGGFIYLATQDWKGRQNITAVALKHKLVLSGLPVEGPDNFDAEDETPFQVEIAGGAETKTISKKLLESYFKLAPGGDAATTLGDRPGAAVPCQVAEVKRVKTKIETLLKDKPDRVEALGGWLLDQSETFDQRQEVKNLIKEGNATELERRLMALFDAVIAPINANKTDPPKLAITDQLLASVKNSNVPESVLAKITPLKNKEYASQEELEKDLATNLSDLKEDERARYQALVVNYALLAQLAEARNKPLDSAQRRNRIASLLVHLSPEVEWQKRVVMVVGLRHYVPAIAAQAVRFKDMYTRLDQLIITDMRGYLVQEENLNRLARSRTDLAIRQSKLKAEKADELTKEDNFIGQLRTQLKTIDAQLQKIKAEVDELLVKQGQIESGLFELQREVAITLDEVYQLEDDLAAREKELLKLKNPAPGGP